MSTNEFGIQDDGSFERKYLDDIQASLLERAQAEFGDDVDLAPGSPHRQLIDLATLELADLWQELEGTYYAAYFPDAVGIQIDRILALAGVSRLERRGATGEVTFTASSAPVDPISIPEGTRVATPETETKPSIPFRTTASATIPAGATNVTQVPIRALEPWETAVDRQHLGNSTNVGANTITQILDPIAGVAEVTNPLPTGQSGTRADGSEYNFVAGRDRETDAELKARYENSLGLGGNATLMGIRAAVYNVEGVTGADIEENTSMNDNTGTGGLPPKSFRVTTVGGADNDIAQAITETRSAGIQPYGSVTGTATLEDGSTYTAGFDRAVEIDIYVDVTVTVDSTFPDDGATRVENNLIRYIGGTTTGGANYTGTEIGEDVLYDMVFSASMNVEGVFGVDLTMGTTAAPTGTTDIVIDGQQVARTDPANINVTVTVSERP